MSDGAGVTTETMPEYDRVKGRTLDLMDNFTRKLMDTNRYALLEQIKAKMQPPQKLTAQQQNEKTNTTGECALALLEFYLYVRPKLFRGKKHKLPEKYTLLGRMEQYAWNKLPLVDLADNPKYMTSAFNRLREFIEEIKLTQFEKEVLSPWQRLAQGMTSRKR